MPDDTRTPLITTYGTGALMRRELEILTQDPDNPRSETESLPPSRREARIRAARTVLQAVCPHDETFQVIETLTPKSPHSPTTTRTRCQICDKVLETRTGTPIC